MPTPTLVTFDDPLIPYRVLPPELEQFTKSYLSQPPLDALLQQYPDKFSAISAEETRIRTLFVLAFISAKKDTLERRLQDFLYENPACADVLAFMLKNKLALNVRMPNDIVQMFQLNDFSHPYADCPDVQMQAQAWTRLLCDANESKKMRATLCSRQKCVDIGSLAFGLFMPSMMLSLVTIMILPATAATVIRGNTALCLFGLYAFFWFLMIAIKITHSLISDRGVNARKNFEALYKLFSFAENPAHTAVAIPITPRNSTAGNRFPEVLFASPHGANNESTPLLSAAAEPLLRACSN